MLADALSTALFVMGEERACAFWQEHAEEYDRILMTAEGWLIVSEGIEERFTAADGRPVMILRRRRYDLPAKRR